MPALHMLTMIDSGEKIAQSATLREIIGGYISFGIIVYIVLAIVPDGL
jgi:hypothetical protein